MDFFQILILASPGPYAWTFFDFFFKWLLNFLQIFFVFVNKTSKRYSSLNHFWIISNFFWIFFWVVIHKSAVLDFWNFEFLMFHDFFFALTWDPMGAKSWKCYSYHKSLLNFSKFFWIFFWVILTKVLFWIFVILTLRFLVIFGGEIKVHHCTLLINWKVRDRHVVAIYINRKPYMESQWRHHILPGVTLKVKVKVTPSLISCKGAELGHMLLLNINRKVYIGSQLMQLHLTFVPFKVYVKVTLILNAYISLRSWVRP